MEKTAFAALRVLVLGGKNHTTQLLRSVLGIAGVAKIVHIDESCRAIELLSLENFHAVFCERTAAAIDGVSFPIAARRMSSVLNPMIPIFVIQDRAQRSDVEHARDTGATDFLTTPISPKTIMTKMQVALQMPRPFIVAPEFFGPDRRAKTRGHYGRDRRVRGAKKTKVDFTHI
jgi:CheY-like chemotaxis protein